jgi:hypothetical protein
MFQNFRWWLSFLLAGFGISSVLAASRVQLGERSIENAVLNSGNVKVIVNYIHDRERATEGDNLSYRIFYGDRQYVQKSDSTYHIGYVELIDLDNNATPEVIVSAYSGGAHCCTTITIYTWQNDRFISTDTGALDAFGGVFEDLNKDKKYEFISVDNAFFLQVQFLRSVLPTLENLLVSKWKTTRCNSKVPERIASAFTGNLQGFRRLEKRRIERERDSRRVRGSKNFTRRVRGRLEIHVSELRSLR